MAQSIVDEIGQILPPSVNLAATLGRAADYATQQAHREVTLEHVLLALTEDPDASIVLGLSQVDIDQLKGDVSVHLGRIEAGPDGSGGELGISSDLRHILEAAAAAARGRRKEIDGAIVLAAIVGDGRSTAAHMLRAHGLTFEDAINALQRAMQAGDSGAAAAEPAAPTAPEPEPVREPEPELAMPGVDSGLPPFEAEVADGELPTVISPTEFAPAHGQRGRSADEILASARQRVQGRIAPGLTDKPVETAGAPPPHHEPVRLPPLQPTKSRPQPNPKAIKAAEDAADAEFSRMAEEAGGRPQDSDTTHSSTPLTDVEETATEAEPQFLPQTPTSRVLQPHRVEHDDAFAHGLPPSGPRPAPPAQRPLPPGAIRRQAEPPATGAAKPATPPDHSADDENPRRRRPRPSPPTPRPGPGAGYDGGDGQSAGLPPPPRTEATRPDAYSERDPFGLPPALPGLPPGSPQLPPIPHAPHGSRQGMMPPTPPPHAPAQRGQTRPPQGRPPLAQHQMRAPPTAPVPAQVAPRLPPAAAAPPPTPSRPAGGAPPAANPKRVSEAALGQLVENIPRVMRVGLPVVVEARIARSDVQDMAEGLEGSGAIWKHELMVSKAMSVRLRAPDGGFFIDAGSPETQWIERSQLTVLDDYASWRWTVTARERGPRRLQLVISARTVGTDGLAAETAFPPQIVNVTVRVNYAKTAKKVGGWALAAIAGGVLARFGEDLPQAIANFTQILIK